MLVSSKQMLHLQIKQIFESSDDFVDKETVLNLKKVHICCLQTKYILGLTATLCAQGWSPSDRADVMWSRPL
jgi:hypothetical protein